MKIVSGAQTGADIAGLWAAKLFGIETCGFAPKGFLTQDGNHPEMAKNFGIKEHPKTGYRDRTIDNIKMSDVTIVLSEKMSPGTKLTIDQCKKLKKKCYVLKLDPLDIEKSIVNHEVEMVIKEIKLLHDVLDLGDFTINIAGNSTANSSRAFEFSYYFCCIMFQALGYESSHDLANVQRYKDVWK
jgi:hypothetical protein